MKTSGYTMPASKQKRRSRSISENWLASHRASVFQVFKYSVYALLTLNVFIFGREEFLAAQLQFAGEVPWADMIEAYASTIDTAAWVVLLLMFELETYLLDDRHFTRRNTLLLHATRVFCYGFIVYALFGYVDNLDFVYDTHLLSDATGVCGMVGDGWSYSVDLDEYVAISTANCAGFTSEAPLMQFAELPAVVDLPGLVEIQRLAWVDVINAAVWILIVVILEVDVRLQEHGRFEGLALRLSNALKVVFYTILFTAAVYWGFKGDFVDFWDAFLWLLAFFFIELNVIEWRHEDEERAEALA